MIGSLIDLVQAGATWAGFAVLTGLWLALAWVTAVVLHKMAPPECPKGSSRKTCLNEHMNHVAMQNAGLCCLYGVVWPVVWAVGAGALFVKSVEVTEKIPVPTFKKYDTKKQLEAATAKVEEEVAALAAQQDEDIIKPKVVHEGRVMPYGDPHMKGPHR